MKRPLAAGIIIIAACAALCAPVWPPSGAEGKVPAETQIPDVTAQFAEVEQPPLAVPIEVLEPVAAQSTEPEEAPPCDDTTEIPEEETPAQKLEDESTEQPRQPAPTTESRAVSPQMGDTRIVDGQKQVYFLGFGWIESSDEPNEAIYAGDMYENGNKIGSMGGGTVVCEEGDINKMVGIMG